MQTPQGYEIVAGRVVPTDWFAVIFNPSFPFRLAHMTVAAYLATALFVGASGAWHLLKGRNDERVRTMLSMAMWMMLLVAPVQIFLGDAHGLNTLEHQPAKIAAIEGHWENIPGQNVPLILFGWPDMAAETTRFALEVPELGSLILTHHLDGRIPGLKEFPAEDRPNSTVIFWTFRIMVGLGMLMLLLGLWSAWLRIRGKLFEVSLFLRCAVAMGPAGLLAILAGWITTEMGRQPWVVYGVMRTKDAVSNHSVLALSTSLMIFVVMYFFVFGTGIIYMLKLVAKGPEAYQPPPEGDGLHGYPPHQRPSRPLSAAPDIGTGD
jgi:cytochrome d ubiquinol oxidase subunit I